MQLSAIQYCRVLRTFWGIASSRILFFVNFVTIKLFEIYIFFSVADPRIDLVKICLQECLFNREVVQ